jgi:uncharacterized repeat protein (TIGR01451 family)
MKKIMSRVSKYSINYLRLVPITIFLMGAFQLSAQNRNYGLIYSDNIKGGATVFGNTLTHIINANGTVNTTAMNDNAANGNSTIGNGYQNIQQVDIDGAVGEGGTTKNSSSADLSLPLSGTNTIKIARLYWGGRANKSDFDLNLAANRTVKIRKGTTGTYTELLALQVDTAQKDRGLSTEFLMYQAYVDVTGFIQANGAGTYTVGNIPLSVGNGEAIGNYGGWSIVVVYENPTVSYNSIRVYDGYTQIYNAGNLISRTVTLTGLDVPSGILATADAKLSVVTWEGDANLNNDFLKINDNLFSNEVNQIDNPWNGTISNNGVHVTTKFPNYTNQMGIDIDQFDVGTGYGILPNATSVKLEFGTELDVYFPGMFAFVIKMKDPTISLNKTVTDANNNRSAEAGEVLTYKLKGINLGSGVALLSRVSDTLPNTITYVPGSLKINFAPGVATGALSDNLDTDNGEFIVSGTTRSIQVRIGVGSNGIQGGTLASLDSFEIEFKATVNAPALGQGILPIINIARWQAQSQTLTTFVDDGIAILNPSGGPLPVTLVAFSGSLINNNSAKLQWATSMELNAKNYMLERSSDNRNFSAVATINANGTSFVAHNYSVTDDISAITSSVVYYRIRQTDNDEKVSYSKVIAIRLSKGAAQLTIAPNPFRSFVNVNIDWAKTELTTVKVYNSVGATVLSKSVQMIKGNNFISLDELANLAAGKYIIQFNDGEKLITTPIVKQ